MSAKDYEGYKESQATISRERSAAGREIGPLPEPADPRRKARCGKSLLAFCRTYFKTRFRLKFAACHFTTISELESCVRDGGSLAVAMPRGSGKTALAECAVLWAILYGHQSFVVLLSATVPLAKLSFKKIKRELENNALLAADFPEVCYPIAKLGGIHNRAGGQTLGGKPTQIEWTAEGVVLPTVAGSKASGAIIRVLGIESAGRGLSSSLPDGTVIRPGLVIVDDAQDRESAKSPTQTTDRELIVTDDLMGMVGPGESLALVMLCTVIYPDDLSDRFLSADKHPEFRRIRIRMIETWPDRPDLWQTYGDLRAEAQRGGDQKAAVATQFYREHRAEMDAGAVLSWPHRKKAGDLSALQTAMNWHVDNPRGFKAECQNDPDPPGGPNTNKRLSAVEVVTRLSGLPRFEVPKEASRLVAFLDCGGGRGRGLWYAVVAFDEGFGGSVVDYGCHPRQARAVFAADDMRPGLAEAYPTLTETARLYRGLDTLAGEVLARTYPREGGGSELRVERCLVDCGWQSATVHQWCRQSGHAGILMPSKGIARTQTARGVSEWKPRPGERVGWHWRVTVSETGRGRMVQFDPDQWKTFVYERCSSPMGSRGCLKLYGKDERAHELFGMHLSAESAEPKDVRGTVFDKWTQDVHRPDNHLLDCLAGCCVAAGVQGLNWSAGAAAGRPDTPPAPKSRLTFAQLVDQKRKAQERKERGR